MKKTKIFMGLAAVVLSVGAFVATKANKKFVAPPGVYANNFATLGTATVTALTTAASSGKTAFIKSGNGSISHTLVTSMGSSHKIYFK